ncbi:hypothetical protein GIV47_30200 [Pseudomonas marginalis]|uniref:hypothetical protein n=1 Tax=Pseudomonas marginalis TaxID=298 RepID=UPI001F340401|nr:hypothetical protein [Pseudomonas marginalis]MCF5669197.1 hypothetical protein [Pseudomonas marginalis]
MLNKVRYNQIIQQYDRYEAAHTYLEQTFGAHAPYTLPDLVGFLVLSVERGTSEDAFKREAKSMYVF